MMYRNTNVAVCVPDDDLYSQVNVFDPAVNAVSMTEREAISRSLAAPDSYSNASEV